jgi:hypothetical protein
MNIILIDQAGACMGVEEYLVHYLQAYGEIINLDRWARNNRLNPKWVREVTHLAELKGLVRVDHVPDQIGRPCKVTLGGRENAKRS